MKKSVKRLIFDKKVKIFLLFSLLYFSPTDGYGQSISGSLTQEELLLSPDEIESAQRDLLQKWEAVRNWLSRAPIDKEQLSRPQAALAVAYLRGGSWPLAWEYVQEIESPIWKAKVVMDVAQAQFNNGNEQLATETLEEGLRLLREISDTKISENASLVYETAATLLGKRQLWGRISEFINELSNPNHLSAFSEAILPLIPEENQEISFQALNRLADFSRIQDNPEETVRQLLAMADVAQRSGREDINGALLFEVVRLGLELPLSPERDELLSNISRHLLNVGSYQLSNRIIRSINDPFIQARSLTTAGRIVAERRNFEAGIPLLQLGRDLLSSFVGNEERIQETTNWVVVELTQAGQLEDAFRVALRLRDPIAQSRALTVMGLVLIDRGQFAEARQVLNFIPYANLRALIYAGLIRGAGEINDEEEVDLLIRETFDSNRFIPPLTGLSARNVSIILSYQLEYGNQQQNEAIFQLANDKLLREERDSFARIDARIRLEKIFAKRGPLKSQEAAVRMESLLNALWQFRGNPAYRSTLQAIVEFYLDVEDIEKAFTTAVSIPEEQPGVVQTEEDPIRFHRDALLQVSVVAARRGNIEYLLQALSLLKNPIDQADTLTAAINILSTSPGLDEADNAL